MTRLERDNQRQIPPSSASAPPPLRQKAPAWVARARVSRWTIGGVAVAVMAVAALGLWLGRADVDWIVNAVPHRDSAEEALDLGVEDRVLVQRGLLELGYDPGEGDGLLGAGTRAALLAWQAERDLEPTAYPTAEALRTIGERAVADSVKVGQAEQARQAAVRGEAAGRRPAQAFRDCEECPEMVVVPAGSYMMGSPASEAGRYADESPQHRVTIGYSLAVGVYEVTFAEWDACVSAGGCRGYRPPDEGRIREGRPAINVSWEDAREYVRWLSRKTGEEYRLLSESEWEYAARAGTTTARYWGESVSGQCRYANGRDQLAHPGWAKVSCSDGSIYTAEVGVSEPNGFGLHDMLGNVFEWTEDCWNESYSGAPADGSAWLSGDCGFRVWRGGSFLSDPRFLRSANRGRYSVRLRLNDLGFRVARTIGSPPSTGGRRGGGDGGSGAG